MDVKSILKIDVKDVIKRSWAALRRQARWFILVVVVLGYVAALVRQAQMAPTLPVDEPLWFMRSRVAPWDLSTAKYRAWQVDIPSLNRWVYYIALKVSGRDRIPPGEKPCWVMDTGKGVLRFKSTHATWPIANRTLASWQRDHGDYAPRGAILMMRYCNITAFLVGLAALWLVGWLVLQAPLLALLPAASAAFSATYTTGVSYISCSGDVFMFAGFAAGAALWMWFESKGSGATIKAAIFMGLLCGLTLSARQQGAYLLAGFLVYLTWRSRGVRRAVNPLIACGCAFAVFAALNPLVLVGSSPWDFARAVWSRRVLVVAEHVEWYGPLSFASALQGLFFWWPIVPAGAYFLWSCRHLWWFPAVGTWAISLFLWTLLTVAFGRYANPEYLAPAELAVFFPVALAITAVAQRHSALWA